MIGEPNQVSCFYLQNRPGSLGFCFGTLSEIQAAAEALMYGKLSILIIFFLADGLAVSQQTGGPPGKGGKGKGGQDSDHMALFQNPQVRAELKVTDDQLAKLPAASVKALADVLDAKQLQRLRG